jgi:hypothetical protein
MPKSGQPWNRHFLAGEPLFRVFEAFAEPFRTEAWPDLSDYARQLEVIRARSKHAFAPLGVLPNPVRARRAKRQSLNLEELYDGRIALTGKVYCLRQSYHDLLNIIIFSAFPLAKRALHARQFSAVSAWLSSEVGASTPRIPGRRTREQDALTIFDEGGVVLVMSEASRNGFQSSQAPIALAPFQPESGVVPILFGHALLEHLHEGHRAIRASGLILTLPSLVDGSEAPSEWCARVDPILAEKFADKSLFQEPKADCIFELEPGGSVSIRHSRYAARTSLDPSTLAEQTNPS